MGLLDSLKKKIGAKDEKDDVSPSKPLRKPTRKPEKRERGNKGGSMNDEEIGRKRSKGRDEATGKSFERSGKSKTPLGMDNDTSRTRGRKPSGGEPRKRPKSSSKPVSPRSSGRTEQKSALGGSRQSRRGGSMSPSKPSKEPGKEDFISEGKKTNPLTPKGSSGRSSQRGGQSIQKKGGGRTRSKPAPSRRKGTNSDLEENIAVLLDQNEEIITLLTEIRDRL